MLACLLSVMLTVEHSNNPQEDLERQPVGLVDYIRCCHLGCGYPRNGNAEYPTPHAHVYARCERGIPNPTRTRAYCHATTQANTRVNATRRYPTAGRAPARKCYLFVTCAHARKSMYTHAYIWYSLMSVVKRGHARSSCAAKSGSGFARCSVELARKLPLLSGAARAAKSCAIFWAPPTGRDATTLATQHWRGGVAPQNLPPGSKQWCSPARAPQRCGRWRRRRHGVGG